MVEKVCCCFQGKLLLLAVAASVFPLVAVYLCPVAAPLICFAQHVLRNFGSSVVCFCFPVSAMAHTAWSTTSASKKLVENLKSSIAKAYAGSGDPEVYDCPHIIDVLAQKYPDPSQLKADLETLLIQTRQLCPTWVLPGLTFVVPAAPLLQQVGQGCLMIWAFGCKEDTAVKGRSNMVNILEVAFSFLENTFNSAQNPVDVLFTEPPGQTIVDFSVHLSLGFTRVLAAYVVLLAMMDLPVEDLKEGVPVLCSLFTVHFTYNPAPSDAAQRARSLAAKFQVSESTRPDPIQIYYTFAEGLKREGADVASGLMGRIKEYNSLSTVSAQNISELEKRVICALPHQTEEFRTLLKYHWQNYKNAESAVPMKLFTFINADVPPEATGVWKEILAPMAMKNELFLRYLIGVFVKNFKDALRMKKSQTCVSRQASCGLLTPAWPTANVAFGCSSGKGCKVRCHLTTTPTWRRCSAAGLLTAS